MKRRILSVFLSMLMVLSAVSVGFVFAPPTAKAADLTNVLIGVPETVYMTPQNNYGTATTSVKYYVNNTISSSGGYSLDATNGATAGKFYVYSPQISSIDSISVDGASLSGLSASKSGSLFSDTSFTMTLSSGISSSQTKLLEWTIKVTDTSGEKHALHAYTVAYNPYLSPVFAAGRCKNTRGSDSFGSGLSWVSGIHGISTAGGYYPYNNFLPVYDSSHPAQGGGTSNPDGWFNSGQQCGLPTKGGWYTSKEYGYNYGDETLCVFERSGEAYINVDTSRYSNLNQIPNLNGGIYVTDNEGAGTVWGYWGKLNNWSDRIQSGRNWYTRSTTNPSEYNASVDIYGGDRWTNRGRNWAIRGCAMNSSIPSGWVAFRGAFGTDGSGDRCFCILDSYVNFIQVNKASLRNLIKDCYKYTSAIYPGETYDNFISAFRTAASVLGNPTSTDVTNAYNTLNSAKNTLKKAGILSLNTQVTVNHTDSYTLYYKFTPTESGKYVFFTYDNDNTPDPYLYLHTPTLDVINGVSSSSMTSNDDIGDAKIRELLSGSQDNMGSYQSYMKADLTAGTTYIVKAYDRGNVGSYPMKVCKAVDIKFDATGGGTTFTKTLPAGHTLHMDQSGLTRDGHRLIAWSTTGTGAEDKSCMASDTITIPGSATTYYALWYPTNPTVLTVNSTNTATISAPSQIHYFTFTPTETRKYLLYSTSTATALDPFVIIYNDTAYSTQGTYLDTDDDGGNNHHDFVGSANRNFYKEIELTAGTKYLFGVKAYHNTDSSSNLSTGSYDFRFEAVYKVKYDAKGGTGAPADQVKYCDKDLTLSTTEPTLDYYTFKGWDTNSAGTTVVYAPGATYTANADQTLYAVWEATPYDLAYDLNVPEGTTPADDYTPTRTNYTVETPDFTLSNPTRTGYTFNGWTGSNGTTPSTAVQIAKGSTGNKNYTANWTAHTYTVSTSVTPRYVEDVQFLSTAPANATHDSSFSFQFKLLDGIDKSDPEITATNCDLAVTKSGNIVTVDITKVRGNVAINIGPVPNIYTLSFSGYGFTSGQAGNETPHHGDFEFSITMDYGYTDAAPASVVATSTLNGVSTTVTATLVSSDPATATYSYKIEDVRGDIDVCVTPTHNIYDVDLSVVCDDGQGAYNGAQLSETTAQVAYLDTYEFTVTLDEAHNQNPAAVTFNGETINYVSKSGDEYTYQVVIEDDSTIVVTPVINQYEVKFFDEFGTQLGETQRIDHGQDATPPAAQLKVPTATVHYHFDGWQNYTNVTEHRNITPTFTSEDHWGGENNVTCTTPGYCEDPECILANGGAQVAYQDTLGGHIYGDLQTDGWVYEWDEDTPPKVVGASVREYRCCVREIRGQVCGYCDEETASIENGKVVSTLEGSATCQAPGTTKYKATFDNPAFFSLVSEELDVAQIPHVFENYVYNNDATCTSDGTETGTCVMCGIAKDVRPAEGTALDHELADEVEYAWNADHTACTATQKCVRYGIGGCNYSVTENATVEIVEDEVSCTEVGNTTYTATFANPAYETQVFVIEGNVQPKGHGAEKTVDEITKEATCTEKGVKTVKVICEDCGYQFSIRAEEIPMKKHVEDVNSVVDPPEATCTAPSIKTTVTTCTKCGQTLSTVTEIVEPAKGHTPGEPEDVEPPIREATCTVAGLKKQIVKCTVCGEVISEQRVTIDKKEHTRQTDYITTPATCVAAQRTTTIVSCTECGAVISRTTEETGDALGHTEGDPTYETILEPTCVRDGQRRATIKCMVCNAVVSKKIEKIDKLGHDPVTTEIEGSRTPSTCTVKGKYSYVTVCSRCEETLEEGEKELDLLPHTPSAEGEVSTIASTCTKAGTKTTTYKCTECETVVNVETETLPLAPHTLTIVPEQAATATEDGWREHFKCTICGKLFGDSDAENELSLADVTIPATGDPSDPGDNPGDNGDNGDSGVCVCGKTHTGPFAWLITLIHRIVYFIRNLFK